MITRGDTGYTNRRPKLTRALHVMQDLERIVGLLGWPVARVRSGLATLHVLGLVDAHGALDGTLALRKLVPATGIDSPIMASLIETRLQPMRMQA
jgi:hypothetical protein